MGKGDEMTDIIDIIDKDTVLPKSNDLIWAKFSSTLFENKLFALGLYNVQKVKTSHGYDLIAEFDNKYLRSILGLSGNSLYNRMKKIENELRRKEFFYEDPEKHRFVGINIITTTLYENGKFRIWFNTSIENKIYDLKRNYTRLSLSLMMNWKSVYSYRLYENLKSRFDKENYIKGGVNTVRIEYDLSELRFTIGCIKIDSETAALLQRENPVYDDIEKSILARNKNLVKYRDWNDIKKRAIDPAIKEINSIEECEFVISYEPRRSGLGGKTSGVIFNVTKKEKKADSVSSDNTEVYKLEADSEKDRDFTGVVMDKLDDLVDEVRDIIEEKISTKEIRILVNEAKGDMNRIRKAYEVVKSKKNVSNFVAYMRTAIREDFELPIKLENNPDEIMDENGVRMRMTHTGRGDFYERVIDYDELEKKYIKNYIDK